MKSHEKKTNCANDYASDMKALRNCTFKAQITFVQVENFLVRAISLHFYNATEARCLQYNLTFYMTKRLLFPIATMLKMILFYVFLEKEEIIIHFNKKKM